jgi:hypothetical protein
MFLPDPDLDFWHISNPGSRVKQSPDPGSAILTGASPVAKKSFKEA